MSFQEIIKGEKPVLVDFFADWCGPCKMMSPILKEVVESLGDSVRVLKIDVDKNPVLATKLRVQGVPTLAIYKKGKMVWRQSGVIPAHQLIPILKENI